MSEDITQFRSLKQKRPQVLNFIIWRGNKAKYIKYGDTAQNVIRLTQECIRENWQEI